MAFSLVDKDKNGSLSPSEIKDFLSFDSFESAVTNE